MIDTLNEGWTTKKNILVILAHPDDPDFFCGAMIARWREQGHQVSYCLLTKGQRGTQDPQMDPEVTSAIRMREQTEAAAVLGVSQIHWMDYMDGELVADLELRNSIIKLIRKMKPQIVISCDPTNLFPAPDRINHPDHRAAGQAVVDAVFPAAGNPGYMIMEKNVSLPAHHVEEVWLSLTHQPDFNVNLDEYLDRKINAILCHRSQISLSPEEMFARYSSHMEVDPLTGEKAFFEKFKRIRLTVK